MRIGKNPGRNRSLYRERFLIVVGCVSVVGKQRKRNKRENKNENENEDSRGPVSHRSSSKFREDYTPLTASHVLTYIDGTGCRVDCQEKFGLLEATLGI